MPNLSVYLLGDFQVRLDGQPITRKFRTDKERALFAYLVVEAGRPHGRETLAELLWPGRSDSSARANLRQALLGVRKALGDQDSPQPFIEIIDEAIQISPKASIWLDTTAFGSRFREILDHSHLSVQECPACIQRLVEAVDLYRQDFLAGLYLEESQDFHEWVVVRREQFSRYLLSALENLADYFQQAGDYEVAQKYAWQYVALEPLEELAHRRIMQLLTLSGRRSAALEQFHTCTRLLEHELKVAPSDETVQLYERIKAGEDLDIPSAALEPAGAGLPAQFTSFIDRESELSELVERLQRPTSRLINVAGPVGCGKTRLVSEAAQHLQSHFKDGVFYLSAEAVNTTDMLVLQLARRFSLTVRIKEARLSLLRYFQALQALLIIDHFDGMFEHADLLLDMLRSAPKLKILIITRQRLNLQAAALFELSGLAFPSSQDERNPLAYPAVQLFMQRARRVRSSFTETPENLRSAIKICQAVHGLPLAIELAASRLRVMPVERLAHEAEQNLEILSTTAQDIPERHRSLAAAIDASWRLLDNAEKDALARLSVFHGRFDQQAAESVAQVGAEMLFDLVEKSLLQEIEERLYSMIPPLRKFAAQHLNDQASQAQSLPRQHADYYLAKLEKLDKASYPGSPGAQPALSAVYPDIRAAVDYASRQADNSQANDWQAQWLRYLARIGTADSPAPQAPAIPAPVAGAFQEQLRASLSAVAKKALPAAVLIVQLNNLAGLPSERRQQALELAAMRLRRLLRAQDSVLPLENDAFGIVLENLSRAVDSYAVARKIFQKLAEPLHIEAENLILEVQIGLGVYPTDGDNPDVLLEKAHATLGGVEKLAA